MFLSIDRRKKSIQNMRQGWLGQTHKINSNVYHTGTSWIWKAINSKRFEKIAIPINCNQANKNSFYTKRSLFLVFTASKILFHTKQHTRKCGYAHTNNHIIHMSVSGRMPTLACLQAAIHALSTQFTFIQSAY